MTVICNFRQKICRNREHVNCTIQNVLPFTLFHRHVWYIVSTLLTTVLYILLVYMYKNSKVVKEING